MLRILEQTDMEQPVLINIERHDERLTIERPSILNVQCSIFNVQRKRLRIVNGLQGITLLIQLDTGEERGMRGDCRLDGLP